MTGPITPDDVVSAKAKAIPEAVFEVFNRHISRCWTGGRAVVKQDTVVAELVERGYQRSQIFEEQMLDVEPAYQAVGWDVEYDKPGYNEDYPATFTFTRAKSHGE